MDDSSPSYKRHFGARPSSFSSGLASPSSSSATTTRERGDVSEETRLKLQNIGWRVRAQVGNGYRHTRSAAAVVLGPPACSSTELHEDGKRGPMRPISSWRVNVKRERDDARTDSFASEASTSTALSSSSSSTASGSCRTFSDVSYTSNSFSRSDSSTPADQGGSGADMDVDDDEHGTASFPPPPPPSQQHQTTLRDRPIRSLPPRTMTRQTKSLPASAHLASYLSSAPVPAPPSSLSALTPLSPFDDDDDDDDPAPARLHQPQPTSPARALPPSWARCGSLEQGKDGTEMCGSEEWKHVDFSSWASREEF
ncbi:uncharacterized protein PFL1_05154 [Pseudozyma flocculosa PF-1]|uniref:Uncharacterized protein n=2 Tax=Pseudozyma flocculosa TaxID=84751 RepID=A0A5C3F7C0_9BASI|nr:uncharacterized protein PFL1_05154 [Pseudozyma flocculosa PF-1]EPQ27231.1 hypothetical protein PFL1_05154 [Pseudozyma flocculosa PF-1]SPO39597.1 uncharacterized protein PSFLO_05078 [Pseudozyma flocculosa]